MVNAELDVRKNKFLKFFLVLAFAFFVFYIFSVSFVSAATTTTFTSNTYNSTNVNVTNNAFFAHLNISTAEPYYFSSSGYGIVSYFTFDNWFELTGFNLSRSLGRSVSLQAALLSQPIPQNTGPYGNYLNFSGSSDSYASVTSAVAGTRTGTITGWFRIDPQATANTQYLFSASDKDAATDWMAVGVGNIGGIANETFWFLLTKENTALLQMFLINNTNGSNQYFDGQWHHFAVATGGQNEGLNNRVFIDGLSRTVTFSAGNTTSYEFSHVSNIDVAYFGRRQLSTSNGTCNCSIDEIMIFNRSLTDAQIQAIYNNQSPRFAPVGYQNFTNAYVASGTDTYANISLNGLTYHLPYQNLLFSNISVSFDGENYTNFTSNGNLTNFSYDGSTGNFKDFSLRYSPSNNSFYSPEIRGTLTVVTWAETGVEITNPLPTNVRLLTQLQNFTVSFNFSYLGVVVGENITVNNLTIGGVEAIRIPGHLWYTSGVGWKVNATAPNDFNLQGYEDLFLNVTYNNGSANLTRTDLKLGAIHLGTAPVVNFIPPTPANGASEGDIRFYNISVYEQDLKNFSWEWNGTNYSLYDDSLVLYLSFNNRTSLGETGTTVLDISKFANNGTKQGGANFVVGGKFDDAMAFDGDGDYITLSSSILNTQNYTKSLWVWHPANYTFAGNNLFSGTALGSSHALWVPGRSLRAGHGNPYLNVSDPNLFPLERWTHVAVTYNSDGTMKLYRDGVEVSSATGVVPVSNADAYIGRFAGGNYFSGYLDEVMLYNRSLSASEIAQLYRFSTEKFNSTTWNFQISERTKPGNHTFSASSCDILDSCSSTSVRSLESLFSKPHVQFVSPSFSNGTYVLRGNNSPVFNFTIEEADLKNLSLEWNSTNNTLFDDFLVFRYNFDNKTIFGETNLSVAYDMSFNGWNRTLSNGAVLTSGVYGNGLKFDGINDYVNAGTVLNANNYSKVTWVKFDGTTGNFFSASNLSGAYFFASSSKIYGGHGFFATSISSPGTISTGRWYHMALTYDSGVSGGTLTMYIDGVKVNQTTSISTPPTTIVYLGDNPGGVPFNGTMDDVMLFNRSLSASEIEQLYYHRLDRYNQTMWNLQINRTNLSAQQYTYGLHACDFVGGCNSSEIRTLFVNPGMIITSPTNASPVNVTLFKNITISFNISESGGDITENVTVNNVTMAGIQALVIGGNQYWFVSGQGWKVNVTTPNLAAYGINGFQDLYVNASYNNGASSAESFDVETGAIHFDSFCNQFSETNWVFYCSEYCVFNTNKVVPGNVTFSSSFGGGEINLSANWTFNRTNSYIFVEPGCRVNIGTSSGFNL